MELVILSRLKWDLSAVTPNAFLEHLLKMISDENSFLERDLMKDIKQIERARENRSSDSTYQAVCNQRSEHANSTVSQQQQQQKHLPSETIFQVETHLSPLPMTIVTSQAKDHQQTQSAHVSPERVTPTEVLEVDLLEVS